MNEVNPDKSGLVQEEILHFVQNDKLPYVLIGQSSESRGVKNPITGF
jgi:hypothetical protein